MGNCTCWHVMELAEGLRRKWGRSQLRTAPCRPTLQGGFCPCEEQGRFDSAFLRWKFKIKSAQQWAFLLLPPITTNSFPVTSLNGGSHCRAEDDERFPVAPDQQWQMCHALPKIQQWCVSPHSHEGHWCSACWNTWKGKSSMLPSCWRGHFLLVLNMEADISSPLVFPGVIWGTKNSGGGCSSASTPEFFPPTVCRAIAGRMGRAGLEHPTAPTEHPPGWVPSLCEEDLMHSYK